MKLIQIIYLFAIVFGSFKYYSSTKKSEVVENQSLSEFQVVGISARISNKGNSVAKEVEAIWERFWNEAIKDRIPNSLSNDIYAIYTDYESDYIGAYTLIIGLKVKHLDNIPSDLVGITVKTDTYEKFVSRGKMPETVLKTWIEIWEDEGENLYFCKLIYTSLLC